MNLRLFAVAVLAVLALSAPAQAKHRYHHSGGSCDGIHRCICGSTQTRHFGLPRIYNGHNLWQAVEWIRAFPRTSPHVGAVGYQHGGGPTGHVFRVAVYNGGCTATVTDEKGTYERNICSRGAIFVDVTGGGFINQQAYSAKTKHDRQHHKVQYASNSGGTYSGPGSLNFGAGV